MNDHALYIVNNALRIRDNDLFVTALKSHQDVAPVFIYDPEGEEMTGEAGLWWLHHSLEHLSQSLCREYDINLVLRKGPLAEILSSLIKETNAETVYYHYQTPKAYEVVKKVCAQQSVNVELGWSHFLCHPDRIRTKADTPYKVFSPFWRRFEDKHELRKPIQKPVSKKIKTLSMKSDRLEEWGLLPSKPNWAEGFEKIWQPGEDGAQKALQRFLEKDISHYSAARDYPARDLTSRLSPYLHFGDISPRQVFYAIRHRMDSGMDNHTENSARAFLRQLGWREFCYYLLYHFPDMPEQGMNDKFNAFSWRNDKHHRISWQKGETGYPLIDAGMRQLWQTGWMHNRVRMVVGSFLVKNLRLHWKEGERWFWDTLLDADLANNTGGWQWVAGCGADAAPYFRIFNPVSQSKKFDPDGSYIRTFLPVLKDMPDRYIHEPWKAPDDVLKNAGIVLGKDYPLPLVDLKKTREEALKAYHALS